MAFKRSRKEFEIDLQAQQSPFVLYGSPLPPLDPDVRDDGSYVPVWKQEVTDDRGRKRLHGAFTGGFSAGYFNTVGSKDGWTPQTFVSSRSKRWADAGKQQQQPEDFMDEEDLADAAESQKIQTQDAFAGIGDMQQQPKLGLVMDLLRPPAQTFGLKLLRKMGWKDGQGIGARVMRKPRLDDAHYSEGYESQVHLFAPSDPPLVSIVRKNDTKGIGFESEPSLKDDHQEDQTSDAHPFTSLKPHERSSKTRTGFGVGVLNDNSDGEDPYDMGPKISFNRTLGGNSKKAKKAGVSASGKTGPASMPFKKSGSSTSSFRRCHDGKLPLNGFVLSEPLDPRIVEKTMNKYAAPKIPSDWTSSKPNSGPLEGKENYKSTSDAAKASALDATQRASILGESRLSGKSVFAFLSAETRQKLANATGRQDLPPGLGERISSSVASGSNETDLPAVSPDVALAALGRAVNGWTPYKDDFVKQERYRMFLEHHGGSGVKRLDCPKSLKRTDWLKELSEFAHAAAVFKPMSGAMASRFTSSTTMAGSDDTQTSEGLLRRPAKREDSEPDDPAVKAAQMDMYGPMTRTITSFNPPRLLCKRFGVDPPLQSEENEAEEEGKPSYPADSAGYGGPDIVTMAGKKPERPYDTDMQTSITPLPETQPTGGIDTSSNDALEAKRAGDAVFKSIFGDDDSEDE